MILPASRGSSPRRLADLTTAQSSWPSRLAIGETVILLTSPLHPY